MPRVHYDLSSNPSKFHRYGKAYPAVSLRARLAGSGFLLAIFASILPQSAWADNECGIGSEVTCGTAGNTYSNGILYAGAGDQIVHLQNGVSVDALDPNIGLLVLTSGATNIVTIDGPTGVSITSEGDGDFGALLATDGGALTANIASITTNGAGAEGIDASSADGAVNLTLGSVTTNGLGSDGVVVFTNTGPITINATTVSTTGTGISAQSDTAPIAVTVGNVTTTGAGAAGVTATSNGANGTVSITNTGLVQTSGTGSVGISATSPLAGVTIASNKVTTTGAGAAGIMGSSTSGPVNITSSGNVTTSGAAAPGIVATSTTGAATVHVTGGAVSSAKDTGLSVSGQTATATISSGASVSGAASGVTLASTTGSTLSNSGSISSSGGFAVATTGGPATINNAGTITGAVSLGGGGDVVNNSGTFAATGNSTFAAGDVFNNTGAGIFRVLPNATTAGSVTMTGLKTFNNAGAISLANGHAGDTLNLPGNYVGQTGSLLVEDFAGGKTPVSDTLVVTGAATGSTSVRLNSVNGGLLTNNLVIARVGTGSTAGAFILSPSSANIGYVGYQLAYNPTTGTFAVTGTANAAVYETLKVEELVGNFSRYSSDAWSDHMSTMRDAHWAGANTDGVHGWGQLFGGSQDRRSGQSATNFGVTQSFDLDTHTNFYGFQLGADAVRGPIRLGITGGYAGADEHFLATTDTTKITGYNIGGYAGVLMGGLFVNGLLKYSGDQLHIASALAGSTSNISAHTYQALVEAGYRLGSETFYVEPVVSLDYQRSRLDDFSALNSSFNFGRYDSELGKAGVRFGLGAGNIGGAKVVPYFAVLAEHEYGGRDGFVFTNGGYDIAFRDNHMGTYGHATAGLTLISVTGVTGYIQGDADFANGARGGGGRVGLRVGF